MIFDEGIRAIVGEFILGQIDFEPENGDISFALCTMHRENNEVNNYIERY